MNEAGRSDTPTACIVDEYRLNRFMSRPRWTDEQYAEAAEVLEGLEAQLAGKLNTPITPIPYLETVAILRSGQVDSTYPVAVVTGINGTAVTNGVLPGGWRMQDGRLYATEAPSFLGQPFSLSAWGGGFGLPGRVDGLGSVRLEYMAGWGNVPALRLAILKKARTMMTNQHDDTVTARDLDASQPPSLPPEEWTPAELADLEIFRNLTAWR